MLMVLGSEDRKPGVVGAFRVAGTGPVSGCGHFDRLGTMGLLSIDGVPDGGDGAANTLPVGANFGL